MILNTILNGDLFTEIKKIPDNSVDLIFADPPYWMRVSGKLQRVEGTDFDGCDDHWDQFNSLDDYNSFTRAWIKECIRVLKPNGSFWVIGSMQNIFSVGSIMQDLGMWIINDVIWHKKNPTPNFKGTRLNNAHETLIWATKSEKAKFCFNYKTAKEFNTDTVTENEFNNGTRKQLQSVWKISVCQGNERLKNLDGEKLHNTQKPEELLRRVIGISSRIGDIVLDPFGGTMTTGAVAKKMGRKYIMIERENDYCKYGEMRLANTIEDLGKIELAEYDKKPPRVTMSEMIKAKYFIDGEKFYIKKSENYATLMFNGKLQWNDETYDMHTLAAIMSDFKADRINGFDYWYVKRDNKLISIDEIRDKYRLDFFSKN